MIPVCLLGLSLVLFALSYVNFRGRPPPASAGETYSYSRTVIVPMQVGILVVGAVFVGIYESFSGPMSTLDSLTVGVLGVLFVSVFALTATIYRTLTITVTPEALVVRRLSGITSVPWRVVRVIERYPKYRFSDAVALCDLQRRRLFEVDSAIADFDDLVGLLISNAPAGTLVREQDEDGEWRERTT